MTTTQQDDEKLSTDVVFETLSNRRRRCVLYYLKHVQPTVTLRDLSEQLAAWEEGVDREEVTPKQRKRLYTALHQTHLPKMDANGIVAYDSNRGTISLNCSPGSFDLYLDPSSINKPWHYVYLALAGVFSTVIVLAIPTVGLFSIGGYTLSLVVMAVFTCTGLYQTYESRRTDLPRTDIGPPREAFHESGDD